MTIASGEALGVAHQEWITPHKQIEDLLEKYGMPGFLADQVMKSALRSMPNSLVLDRSREILPPSLFDLSIEKISILTNWYTALERIRALPDTIPPLPENIYQILEGECPIFSTDETPLSVGETHSLYLIPPGTLNEFEQCISTYGKELLQEKNPLKFCDFFDEARAEYADLPNSKPQWVLISNDVLPGSENHSYPEQVQIVKDLSEKSEIDYQVPTLREAIVAMFLDKIAGNKMFYKEGTEQDDRYVYTRVKETTRNFPLYVGSCGPSGLEVFHDYNHNYVYFGIGAVRKI